jgi:hypothetical protein
MHKPRQQRRKLIVPVFIFSLRQFRQVSQGLPDGGIKFPFKQREERVPYTIARVASIQIGSIFAPQLSQSFEVGLNFSAASGQQGPNQMLRLVYRRNAG